MKILELVEGFRKILLDRSTSAWTGVNMHGRRAEDSEENERGSQFAATGIGSDQGLLSKQSRCMERERLIVCRPNKEKICHDDGV